MENEYRHRVIDNNLSFFEFFLIFVYRLVFEPLIYESNECVYTTHADRCFLTSELFYRFGIPLPPFCPNLPQMVSVIFLFILIVLAFFVIVSAECFDKTHNGNSATSDIKNS